MKPVLLALVVLICSCATYAPVSTAKADLEAMLESDQRFRSRMEEVWSTQGANSPDAMELWKKQQAVDDANVERLSEIVRADGWPRRSVVGEMAASAAFLVVQHADLVIQEKYLPLFRSAVAANEARGEDLALLEDRVLTRQGKKQLYGSQLRGKGKGGWEFYPIEDESRVDQRRKAVGLPPLAEYAREYGIEYQPAGAEQVVPGVGARPAAESQRRASQ